MIRVGSEIALVGCSVSLFRHARTRVLSTIDQRRTQKKSRAIPCHNWMCPN